MATYSSHRLIMGKEEIDNFFCLIGDIYTPGIYGDGYIVFAFPFVRSSVRMFVSSFVRPFVLPSRSWNLRQSFALKFLK